MTRQARRARPAPRLERLEARALLSALVADPSEALFVRFQPNVPASDVSSILGAVGGQVVESLPDGPSVVTLAPGSNRDAVVARLAANAEVLYAEPDGVFHAESVVPFDPSFSQQWGLSSPNGVDIGAPLAWGVTVGNPSTIVAVLDTGIDFKSPDLAGKIWTNPTPFADPQYPNDQHGWNFVSNTNKVQDNDGHGTHVSGVIAASTNNGVGVAGIDWNAQIMPLKVLDSNGNGTDDAIVNGVYFAVNHGARVINGSFGGGDFSPATIDALNYAGSRGVVFVVAAGNDGRNSDGTPEYPASYRLPNEISVAAIDTSGNLPSYSNYGANSVDLAAPGVDVLSTVPGGYATMSGTSMATPFVSGVVSLLVGQHPDWSAAQLVHQILYTVKPLATLNGRVIAGGMVDAYNAVANIVTWNGHPGGGVVAQSMPNPLQPNASRNADVLASLLASDAYYMQVGRTTAGYINGLFQAVLGRAADPGGFGAINALLQQGGSRFQAAQTLINTPEANLATVARWYQQYFGIAQPLGVVEQNPSVQGWAATLGAFGPNATLAGILSTDAFWNDHGGTDASFVNAVFQTVLGRAADPGGLNYFTSLLRQGVSRFDVIRDLQGTAEAKLVAVARWYVVDIGETRSLAALVKDSGVAFWAGYLGNF